MLEINSVLKLNVNVLFPYSSKAFFFMEYIK
jgi:hypothetical protein